MAGWIEGERMKHSKLEGDDKVLAQNLARKREKGNPRRGVKVQDEIIQRSQFRGGKGKQTIVQQGTQTNVPEVQGRGVAYRKAATTGRGGKSSDVFLVGQKGGGAKGRVGVSTALTPVTGKLKFKAAERDASGRVKTDFKMKKRRQREEEAVRQTPRIKPSE